MFRTFAGLHAVVITFSIYIKVHVHCVHCQGRSQTSYDPDTVLKNHTLYLITSGPKVGGGGQLPSLPDISYGPDCSSFNVLTLNSCCATPH